MTAPRARFSPRPPRARRAFTLIEVLVALAISALMGVALVASYVNILNSYQRMQRRPARDLDLTTARNALLAQSDFDTAEKGDQFDGATGRHVTWSSQIDPTTTADLFQVTFTCMLTGGTDKDETITEVFRALRPTWSQGTDSATLRATNKDRILQSLQPSPLSGLTSGIGGGAGGVMGNSGGQGGNRGSGVQNGNSNNGGGGQRAPGG